MNSNDKELQPVWTVTANIVHHRGYGPGGLETKSGTKHFKGGAKVYIIDWYAGMCEDVIVVGQHRKSRDFIKVVTRVEFVENLRVKLCYNPKVIAKANEHFNTGPTQLTEDFVTHMYTGIPFWQKEIAERKAKKQARTEEGFFKTIWSRLKGNSSRD
jgi:hypothetical protein